MDALLKDTVYAQQILSLFTEIEELKGYHKTWQQPIRQVDTDNCGIYLLDIFRQIIEVGSVRRHRLPRQIVKDTIYDNYSFLEKTISTTGSGMA